MIGPRLQAFAVNSPSSSTNMPTYVSPNSAKSRQIETRQRQLEILKRMEERYRNMGTTNKPSTGLVSGRESTRQLYNRNTVTRWIRYW